MVSREQAFHDKLQILRSVTHSRAMNESSIVLDASNYIKELKQKVERLNEEISSSPSEDNTSVHHQNLMRPSPREVTVETLEKGFLVNVQSGKSCPGLLVSILTTFEDLGLHVLEARVSCADTFHLQAIGGQQLIEVFKQNEEDEENVDAQMVKRAISNTIKNWRGSNE